MLSSTERFICSEENERASCLSFHQLSINLGKALKEGLVEEVLSHCSIIRWKVAENYSSVLSVHG